MARPLRTASGSATAAPLVLFDVVTDGGVTGRSYVFAYDPALLPALTSVAGELGPGLTGKALAPGARMREFQARFRLPGMQGVAGMVVSGIEMALWDALGHLTGLPVATLLGGEPAPLRAYDSYGMIDPVQEEEALRGSVESGFRAVKIKLGHPDAARDGGLAARLQPPVRRGQRARHDRHPDGRLGGAPRPRRAGRAGAPPAGRRPDHGAGAGAGHLLGRRGGRGVHAEVLTVSGLWRKTYSAYVFGMKILVVGAGAVGGFFGGRLVQAGRDVTFLVRPKRARLIEERGLRIVGLGEDTTLHPHTVLANEITSTFDLVLVSVKAAALRSAMDDFAPAVGPGTLILPVLNGMRHIDELAGRFGERRVLGGVVMVSTTLDADGDILRLADVQSLTYGSRAGPAPDELVGVLGGAGFETRLAADIIGDMWAKWVFIAATGAVTCLMRATVGEIASTPGGVEFARAVVAECAAVAEAAGHPVPQESLGGTRRTVTATHSSLTSSAYRDLIRDRPVEVEEIFGDLVRRAHRSGTPVPLLSLVTLNLRVYQRRRA